MTDTLRFTITFHTPFRVATGQAGNGADSTVDRVVPLPASSLKGLMRSAGCDLLRLPDNCIDQVYGAGHQPSPWSWSDATIIDPADWQHDRVRRRARVRIDPDTATVADGALAIAEEILVRAATFEITRTGWLPAPRRDRHRQVLLGCARAVTAVGGDRRRGLGWVSVTPSTDTGGDDPAQLAQALLAMRTADGYAGTGEGR